jgi:XTP/dITP diphosphohydrolase
MPTTTLLLASRNRHKTAEIRAILGVECLSLDDVAGAPPLLEDADTFAGNAARKATQLTQWLAGSGLIREVLPDPAARGFVLADDSGLEVDALQGAPGVYSARFAALEAGTRGNCSDALNNARLLRLLRDVTAEKRTARFRCVLALVALRSHAPLKPEFFEGTCEGRIGFGPRGAAGFGYDPLFMPDGFTESFAELGAEAKNKISHRARALARLHTWLAQT